MNDDAISISVINQPEFKETQIVATFKTNLLSAQMPSVAFSRILDKLTDAYIEAHGADILSHIAPGAIETEIKKKIAEKVIKGLEG